MNQVTSNGINTARLVRAAATVPEVCMHNVKLGQGCFCPHCPMAEYGHETREKAAGGAWVIMFDDADVKPEIYSGNGAEQAALKAYNQFRTNWSCHLFECIRSTKDDENGGRRALKASAPRERCPLHDCLEPDGHCYCPAPSENGRDES